MGSAHAQSLLNQIKDAELTAVCDVRVERLKWAEEHLPESVQKFTTPQELYESHLIDAVLICTPHYDHPTLAIEALQYGYHVLVEKPLGSIPKLLSR